MTVVPLARRHYDSLHSLLDGSGKPRWAYDLTSHDEPVFPTYVATDPSGEVIGVIEGRFDSSYDERFLYVAGDPPHAWVYLIVVSPQRRRLGVGKALLRTFTRDAIAAGCTFLALMPDQEEPVDARIAFFRSCGLRPLLPEDPRDVLGSPIHAVAESLSG